MSTPRKKPTRNGSRDSPNDINNYSFPRRVERNMTPRDTDNDESIRKTQPPMPQHPPPLPPPLRPFIGSASSFDMSASVPLVPTLYPQQALQMRKDSIAKKSHSRSISFPAIFRKKSVAEAKPEVTDESNDDSNDESDGDFVSPTKDTPEFSPRSKQTSKVASTQNQTGACITCGQSLRWPKEEQAIRCPRCSCIHDVSSIGTRLRSNVPGEFKLYNNKSISEQRLDAIARSEEPKPGLSLSKTNRILTECFANFATEIYDLFDYRLKLPQEHSEASREPKLPQSDDISDNPYNLKFEDTLQRDEKDLYFPIYDNETSEEIVYSFRKGNSSAEELSTFEKSDLDNIRHPEDKTQTFLTTSEDLINYRQQIAKTVDELDSTLRELALSVFKPVESHVVLNYGDSECLNNSFRKLSIDSTRNDEESSGQYLQITDSRFINSSDVAREPKYPEVADIDCNAVDKWYSAILQNWSPFNTIFEKIGAERYEQGGNQHYNPQTRSDVLKVTTTYLDEVRMHVQRVILKITEKILVRPRVDLQDPRSVRLLVIISCNPLLISRQTKKIQHPNITKRLIGLIVHLPDRSKRRYKDWLLHVDSTRLRDLVETAQAFITHRLYKTLQKLDNSNHRYKDEYIEIPTRPRDAKKFSAGGKSKSEWNIAKKTLKLTPYCADWQLKAAAKYMSLLFWTNEAWSNKRTADSSSDVRNINHQFSLMDVEKPKVLSPSDFYNLVLDYRDTLRKYLRVDFMLWEAKWHHNHNKFTFCEYPFLLSMSAKNILLKHDYQRQIMDATQNLWAEQMLSTSRQGGFDMYNTVRIRRDCLIDDSLMEVDRVTTAWDVSDSKKKLRVEFVGEEGIDAGGVSKEWFHLALRELFDPDFGVFIYEDESKYCYFNRYSFEDPSLFYRIGCLLGLAVYNDITVNVPLPKFFFFKLASTLAHGQASAAVEQRHSYRPTVADVEQISNFHGQSLRYIADANGQELEALGLSYVFPGDRYGYPNEVPLCTNGTSVAVTAENRKGYIKDFANFMINTGVERYFQPLARGFQQVAGGNAMSLLHPSELDTLLRGSEITLDLNAIKSVARYEGWADQKGKRVEKPQLDPVVVWFWEYWGQMDPSKQLELLRFITGTSRIPWAGASSLSITVQFAGEDGDRLPMARTCFNVVYLWRYPSQERLAQKLNKALEECGEGFGIK